MTATLWLALLTGCPKTETDLDSDVGTDTDTDTEADTDPPVFGCFDTPQAEDRDRVLLAQLPFEEPRDQWAVLSLDTSGSLVDANTRVSSSRAFDGHVRFTRDGRLAVAMQDDGTIGVFAVSENGGVTVTDTDFGSGTFYARDAVWDPENERLLVVDNNWQNNGGGIYDVDVDCETGALTGGTRILETKNASGLHLLGGDRALVVTREVGTTGDADVWLVDLATGAVIDSLDLFPGDEAIVGATAMVGQDWLLVADNCGFCANNAVGVVEIDGDTLTSGGLLPMADPYAIGVSPWGNAALVSLGFEDEIRRLTLTEGSWTDAGAVAAVPLPGRIQVLDRGPLQGLAFAAQNLGVRVLAFGPDGSVTDRGNTSLFGQEDVGAVGLQP